MTPGDVVCPRGVQLSCVLVGVLGLTNLELPYTGPDLVGDPLGVGRSGVGDEGDSARRNGELLVGGEPYPKGDGLYDVETDC